MYLMTYSWRNKMTSVTVENTFNAFNVFIVLIAIAAIIGNWQRV